MILTKKEILKEIENGRFQVTPFNPDAVGPASIDLSLNHELRFFDNIEHSIRVAEGTDYKDITTKITVKDKFTIKPGELVLGITEEHIKLPDNICGWLNSRSRFARLGLMVHITAPFIQPGEEGRQVLEIYNAGPNNLDLIPGERLCQLILQRCEGHEKYEGKFKEQQL